MTVTWGTIDHVEPLAYGSNETYELAARFFGDCDMVEDWGCGRGWFRAFVEPGRYRGIDVGVDSVAGPNPFADEIADLREYRSPGADGILLRHVLEHNVEWQTILENAVTTRCKKILLVVFTPWSDETHVMKQGATSPYLSFDPVDLAQILTDGGFSIRTETVMSSTEFASEHLVYAER